MARVFEAVSPRVDVGWGSSAMISRDGNGCGRGGEIERWKFAVSSARREVVRPVEVSLG